VNAAWEALREAGLVRGDPPAAPLEPPWFVRLMLGVAGWIAALFLLGFVAAGLSWLVESEVACIVAGLLGSGVAWLLLRKLEHNEFAAQFALAVSFAGQALFAYGVFGLFAGSPDSAGVWLVLALQQAALVALMPNATHRLWSGFAAAAAVTMALRGGGAAFLAPALLLGAAAGAWLNEFRWPRFGPVLRPAAYGVVLALAFLELAAGLSPSLAGPTAGFEVDPAGRRLYGELLSGAILLWVVWALLRRAGAALPGRTALVVLAGAALAVLVSLEAPGIAASVCILLLGFAHGNRVLTGLGGAALLLYAGGYYYELHVTLLVKSQVLAATGIVLLVVRWLLLRSLAPGRGGRQ
jgi:uncharacterized membrane protein